MYGKTQVRSVHLTYTVQWCRGCDELMHPLDMPYNEPAGATMTETIAGVYRNGAVELSRQPQGAENAAVLVTFLPAPAGQPQPPDGDRIAEIEALVDLM